MNKGEVPENQLMAQGRNTALSIRDRGMAYMSVGRRDWSTQAQEAEGNLIALAEEFKRDIQNPYLAEFDNFQSPLSPAAIDNFLSALNAWEVDPPSGNRDKASNGARAGRAARKGESDQSSKSSKMTLASSFARALRAYASAD